MASRPSFRLPGVTKGRRFAAAASAFLLLAAFVPSAAAAPPPKSITFSAQRGTASLVASYTVTPAERASSVAASSRTADLADQLPELAPKEAISAHAIANAPARPAASTAATADGRDAGTPPLRSSFMGLQGSNITCSYFPKGCNPPDMAIASSPTRVLQGVNTTWAVYDTAGNVLSGWPRSAQSFFGVPSNTCDPAANGQPFLSDPRAFYDPRDGRFWAAMLQLEGALGVGGNCPLKTVYYIAVSRTSDPSGAWNVYEFDMSLGTTNVADYTQIGLNGDAVFFSANIFNEQGTAYEYAEIFEANKQQMEQGRSDFTAQGFFNLQAHGPGGDFLADTVQPTFNMDGGDSEHFVDTLDGPDPVTGNRCSSPTDLCRGVAVWRMDDPVAHDRGGHLPSLTATAVDTVGFMFPPAADQPTCARCLDANDLRIPGTPVEKDGTIYTAWGTGIDNGSGIVPGIVSAEIHGRTARSSYYFFSGDTAATYPAVMPTEDGRMAMVFERMGSTINPETRYILSSDNGRFSGPGRLLKAGEAPYRPTLCGTSVIPVCRWGDYEATAFDGRARVWLAGEYANSFTDPTAAPVFGRNWGTWIGSIEAH